MTETKTMTLEDRKKVAIGACILIWADDGLTDDQIDARLRQMFCDDPLAMALINREE